MIRLQKRALAALVILSVLAAAPVALGEADLSIESMRSLRYGDRGDLVSELQQRLAELGYLHDRIDGRFGTHTRQAVNRFQKSEGLKVSGIADESMQALLFDPDVQPVTVFVAPTGKRYHVRANCRGLNAAKSISGQSFTEAVIKRTPCIICYGRQALAIAEERRAAREQTPSPAQAAS